MISPSMSSTLASSWKNPRRPSSSHSSTVNRCRVGAPEIVVGVATAMRKSVPEGCVARPGRRPRHRRFTWAGPGGYLGWASDGARYDRATVSAAPPIATDRIRNFSIISHVDHGKSTLSDRILELTGAVDPRLMREQYLDSMDIERERGITIKAQNVRVGWKEHVLHLIDTPGHVDFGYEVSRSLAACEGAVLLVDASQGIQAQTLANCYQAIEHDLEIVAVLNKIDLPAADPERCAKEIENVLGLPASDILHISAKTGEGVPDLLDAIVARIPPPAGDPAAPLQALIFDSSYDQYRGVVSSIRVKQGTLRSSDKLRFIHANANHEIEEIGVRTPVTVPVDELGPGEVGYLIAGIKNVGGARSGETVTTAAHPAPEALAGYRDPKPMVFCGLFPIDGDDLPDLRDALEKLRLNDASFTYEPESSRALGFGFRCGFLGLLHMEIVRERLEREFDLALIATAPSVAYQAHLNDGTVVAVDNPSELPDPTHLDHVDEPMLKATILTPAEYTGTVMELAQGRRAEMTRMEFLSPERRRVRLRDPPGRGGGELLRPAEEPHQGLRQPRLRALRVRHRRPGQGGPAHQPHPGGRLLDHRPQVPGRLLRAPDDREAAGADPPADVRRPHPGGHRRPGAGPGDGQGPPQGRPGQVLRG